MEWPYAALCALRLLSLGLFIRDLRSPRPSGSQVPREWGGFTTRATVGRQTLEPERIERAQLVAYGQFAAASGPPSFGLVPSSMLWLRMRAATRQGSPSGGSTQKRFSRIAASVRSA